MRCNGGERLANSASHIPINMKPARVKPLSGDIYTIRPAEKHSTCAVNSLKVSLWRILWEAGSLRVMWQLLLYCDYGYFDAADAVPVPIALSGITAVVKHKNQNVT